MWKFMIIVTFFSAIWVLKASEDLDEVNKPSKTGCNSIIQAQNSAFQLDLHNLSHPCQWTITPNNSGPINLFFSSVLLHFEDELTIYKSAEDAKNHTNPLIKEPIHSQNGSLTIITNETEIVLVLTGVTTAYNRIFEGYYSVNACSIPVPPEVEILNSPTYLENVPESVACEYRFNEITHKRAIQAFSFEEFNVSLTTVEVTGGTFDGHYSATAPTDFFIKDKLLKLTVKQALNSSDHFKLKIHEVDKSCSGVVSADATSTQLKSPTYILNNGTIEQECRWLVTTQLSQYKTFGLRFDKLDFQSVLDIVAVNDGLSEFSQPLLQVTTSNRNTSQSQMIRASGPHFWVSFKPVSYKSSFIANITTHGQGGFFKNNGSISMNPTTGDDTVFLLEVDDGKVVELNSQLSAFSPPATLTVYDGFDMKKILTSLHGQIKFPILSTSSRMMIIGTHFSDSKNAFTATFQGIVPGCDRMSSVETDSYILSENCNSTCQWIIPPQDSPNSALVVNLQYISLQNGDIVRILKLDDKLTELGLITANETRVPHFTLPANVGALISVTQAACKERKDRIVLIGQSSYNPGCIQNISTTSSQVLQISSPLYPDTYPVYANCLWNISTPKGAIVHLAFETFSLTENHCVEVSQKSGMIHKYEGTTLPAEDLFLSGDLIVEFDSSGCNKTAVGKTFKSDVGFLLNVTVTDCGKVMDSKIGEFNTNVTGNQRICIWKVTVPATEGDSVNIISYTFNKNDSLKNYEIHVYDGETVRKPEINVTSPEIWSRTNTLIFVYKRLNISEKSSVLTFKYNTISCNTSMQCANKICMHPDWLCNKINDCGDYSDESHCESVPIPPTKPTPVKYTGYSATAFWLCILAMLIIGIIAGLTVPVCYQKYRDSRYRRFHELDG